MGWSLVEVISGILGLAILLGVIYAAFSSSNLRTTVKDQALLITSLKSSRDEEKLRRELVEERLALVEDKARHLEEIVSGRIDFSALETALEHHHVEAVKRMDTIREEFLGGIRDVKGLLEAQRAGDQP
jgi:Tfp pilus assembly protein PilE